jgi:hypothetical protein
MAIQASLPATRLLDPPHQRFRVGVTAHGDLGVAPY